MKIQFIGTGSGKTSLKRFHSSFLILSHEYNLLIDCGDGISKALLSQKIPYNSVNGIMISHIHPDHFSGLSALLIQMKLSQRKNNLDIYVHGSLIEVVKNFIYHSYIFSEKMDFLINYIPFSNDKLNSIAADIKFISKQNTHLEPYKIYDSSNILSFSCCSFLFSLNEVNFQYTGDIGKAEDLTLFRDFNIHTLISETSHVDIPGLINASELLKIKRLILTHISDEDESNLFNLVNTQDANISFEIIAAYDGLIASLNLPPNELY